jgi:aminoglycoside 3-N-acetyltransferase
MIPKAEVPLYFFDDIPITQKDIESALRNASLREGDVVLVHSDVSTIGKIGIVRERNEFLELILSAFLNVLGKEGTLVVPTYTYSFCKGQVFDIKNSASTVGIFSEFVRTRKKAIRSEDPLFSHAGIGMRAEKLLCNIGKECFGKDSFFDRLCMSDGKIMYFGKAFEITFAHYIEKAFQVNYRYDKSFSGTVVRDDGSAYQSEVIYYVRCLPHEGKDVCYNIPVLASELEKKRLLKNIPVGSSQILCAKAQDCYVTGIDMLKRNEYAFLTKDPCIRAAESN